MSLSVINPNCLGTIPRIAVSLPNLIFRNGKNSGRYKIRCKDLKLAAISILLKAVKGKVFFSKKKDFSKKQEYKRPARWQLRGICSDSWSFQHSEDWKSKMQNLVFEVRFSGSRSGFRKNYAKWAAKLFICFFCYCRVITFMLYKLAVFRGHQSKHRFFIRPKRIYRNRPI